MNRSFLILFLSLCFSCSLAHALDTTKVDQYLVQGYQAVDQNHPDEALQLFTQASRHAQQIKDWQGIVDAAYGLATLERPQEALPLFTQAAEIAKQQQSWAGLVAAGYGLASLPEELNAVAKAEQAFTSAESIALETQDWRGLVESAKGFQNVLNPNKAEQALDQALTLVEQEEDTEGAQAISQVYEKLGKSQKAKQTIRLARNFGKSKIAPPPGWSPTGKSIRSTKEVPMEAQKLNRASADQDITNKIEYIKHSEKLEQQEKERRTRLAEAYLNYAGYYTYPGTYYGVRNFGLYGFGRYHLTYSHRRSWAHFHLSRYDRRGSIYIRIGGRSHHYRH